MEVEVCGAVLGVPALGHYRRLRDAARAVFSPLLPYHQSSSLSNLYEWLVATSIWPPLYVPRFFLVFSWRKSLRGSRQDQGTRSGRAEQRREQTKEQTKRCTGRSALLAPHPALTCPARRPALAAP